MILLPFGHAALDRRWTWLRPAVVKDILGGEKKRNKDVVQHDMAS